MWDINCGIIRLIEAPKKLFTVWTIYSNLKVSEILNGSHDTWNCLENLYLPFLQILNTSEATMQVQ
ncbi:hypothetical protein C1645_836833 [Glomus cerebriforme]|uniref:Uncharacterized protein n=1 Tax=Glomus cerebriforme TaxID=658196 RepID=A0A397SB78_9GLOM|nr:hypothetical protein C1645_836833 [Glomus cerebriforme]